MFGVYNVEFDKESNETTLESLGQMVQVLRAKKEDK